MHTQIKRKFHHSIRTMSPRHGVLTLVLLLVGAVPSFSQLIPPVYQTGGQTVSISQHFQRDSMIRRALHNVRSLSDSLFSIASADRALYLSAETDFKTKDRLLADKSFQRLISERINSLFIPFAWFHRAIIAFEQLDYTSSAKFFNEAVVTSDNNGSGRNDSAYIHLGHLSRFWQATSYSHLGQYDDAEPIYEDLTTNSKGTYSDDAYFALGQIAETKNQHKKAIEYYGLVRQYYPYSNSVVYSRLREAQCNLHEREAKTAISLLESSENLIKFLASNDTLKNRYENQSIPFDVQAQLQFLKGEALNQVGEFRSAIPRFDTTLTLPASELLQHQAKLGAGWANLNIGNNTRAISLYSAVIDSVDEEQSRIRGLALLYRAVAYKRNKQRDSSKRELNALTLQSAYPFMSQALMELGQIYYEDGNLEVAKQLLERAERESGDVVTETRITLLLGALYSEQQSWQRAIRAYQQAEISARKATVVVMPQREQFITEAKFKRGVAYVQNNQLREGMNDLNAFIGENDNHPRVDEALFWLGEAYYRAELMKNAEDTYRKILSNYPTSQRREETLYGLGWTLFRTMQFDKTTIIFTQLLDEYPKSKFSADVYVRKGDALYLTKQYIESAKAYKEAYKRSPKSEEGQYASFQIGQALYRSQDYTNSITQLRTCIKNFPTSPLADDALYTIAWIKTLQEKHDEAITEFESLVKTYSQSELVPQSIYYIGNAKYNKGDFEGAISEYKRVIDEFPTNYFATQAFQGLQYALIATGREQEAIAAGKEFAEKNPGSSISEQVEMKTNELFIKNADYSNAAKEYQNFIKKYPESDYAAEAMYWLAKSQVGLNQLQQAEDSYSLLIKKYPTNDYSKQALLEFALLKLSITQVSKADSLFRIIEDKFPNTDLAGRALYERAQILLSNRDTVSAMNLFLKGASTTSGEYSLQSRYRIAMYLRERNLNDSARIMFQPLVQNTDNPLLSAEAQFRIGELWAQDKNWQNAAIAYAYIKENFDGQEPWFTVAMINLGECYEKLNDMVKARETYQTIIILHPADDYGKTAQSRLKRLGR